MCDILISPVLQMRSDSAEWVEVECTPEETLALVAG